MGQVKEKGGYIVNSMILDRWSQEKLTDSIVKLKENLQEINPKLPFALMLPEDRNIPTVNTLIGLVARGSVLHKQLQWFQMGSTNPVTSCDPISYQSPNAAMNGSGNESSYPNKFKCYWWSFYQPLRKFYWQSAQAYTHWTRVSQQQLPQPRFY